jgi:hypothetical protein
VSNSKSLCYKFVYGVESELDAVVRFLKLEFEWEISITFSHSLVCVV